MGYKPARIGSVARPASLRSILAPNPAQPALVEGGVERGGTRPARARRVQGGVIPRRPGPGPFATPRQKVTARVRPVQRQSPPPASPGRPAFAFAAPWTEPGPPARLRPGRSLQSRARPSLRHRWRRAGRAIHLLLQGVTVRLAAGYLCMRSGTQATICRSVNASPGCPVSVATCTAAVEPVPSRSYHSAPVVVL